MRNPITTLAVALCTTALLAGCGRKPSASAPAANPSPRTQPPSPATLPPEIVREVEAVGRRQAQGLDGATTVVHRAFHYRPGGQNADNEEVKRVAVDVEFKDPQQSFDLDDVDVIDGRTGENFGSDPQIILLRSDGSLEQNDAKWESEGETLRVLLIYSVPQQTTSVKLGYWGNVLTAAATDIGEGQLRHDESRVLDGVEFWPYPESRHFGGVWQRGRWLIVGLSFGYGVAVVDLHAWPPEVRHWDCNLLRAIEAAPQGGWMVITRSGYTAETIRFPLWHHAEEQPGASSPGNEAVGPDEHLEGLIVIDQTTLAHDARHLYRLAGGKLQRVEGVQQAVGIEDEVFDPDCSHGQIALADGRRLVLWDGDAYPLVDGRLGDKWELDINEPSEFSTSPWGPEGFYFLENRQLYRVRPGAPREHVLPAAENIMGFHPGPDDSLLLNFGNNAPGQIGGIWFTEEHAYVPVHVSDLSGKLSTTDFATMHWSAETQRFYFVAREGIFTVPAEQILKRRPPK